MEAVLHILVCVAIALFSLLYWALRKRLSYWAERGVVHEKPVLFYGNMREVGRTLPLRQPFRDLYAKYKGVAPFCGFYLSMRHAAVLLDLELVKCVLIKDFANFAHRGNYYNERDDPLSGHLFNLDGPKWRSMRTKLSPTFTSGKMKFMFTSVVEVAEKFVDVLGGMIESAAKENEAAGEAFSLEIRDLLARFTTDVIGTCAFGLECNSLKDPNTEFRLMGKKIFKKRRHGRIIFGLMQAFPDMARRLRLRSTPDDVSEFFMRVVRETVEYREREGVQRNDFMNLLLELKHRKDIDALTLEEMAAQAFVFFIAGFETSSSTMSFCLYELALNQDVQDRVRDEINEMLERYEGKFTYEAIHELKYLQQVLHETMRMYSIVSFVIRKTIEDYKVPNAEFVIESGTPVIIPVDAIHNDPEIYPNPEVFDPERFAPAEVEKRSSVSWLPFGEGPRNCIGLRFGEMQAMVGLTMLLKNFRFSPGKDTKIPLQIKKESFLLEAEGGIVLQVDTI